MKSALSMTTMLIKHSTSVSVYAYTYVVNIVYRIILLALSRMAFSPFMEQQTKDN